MSCPWRLGGGERSGETGDVSERQAILVLCLLFAVNGIQIKPFRIRAVLILNNHC